MDWLRRYWLAGVIIVAVVAWAHITAQDAADSACKYARKVTIEVNKRTPSLKNLRNADKITAYATRASRSDKNGTSYDPVFVWKIDHLVLPKLRSVQPTDLAVPKC
jgi:hypothetical protein